MERGKNPGVTIAAAMLLGVAACSNSHSTDQVANPEYTFGIMSGIDCEHTDTLPPMQQLPVNSSDKVVQSAAEQSWQDMMADGPLKVAKAACELAAEFSPSGDAPRPGDTVDARLVIVRDGYHPRSFAREVNHVVVHHAATRTTSQVYMFTIFGREDVH